MTQRDLDRAVARATGESLSTFAASGFSLLDPESEVGPHLVDWDRVQLDRNASLFRVRRGEALRA